VVKGSYPLCVSATAGTKIQCGVVREQESGELNCGAVREQKSGPLNCGGVREQESGELNCGAVREQKSGPLNCGAVREQDSGHLNSCVTMAACEQYSSTRKGNEMHKHNTSKKLNKIFINIRCKW
jgi:hypothetical protein